MILTILRGEYPFLQVANRANVYLRPDREATLHCN